MTDTNLTLPLRPGVVLTGGRERLDVGRERHRHFDAATAAAALPLIANTIWGVFPDQDADQEVPPTLAEPVLASEAAVEADAPES